MLVLENINITLGKGTKLPYKVLNSLNLIVSHGEFLVIIGSNGAGKSTIFNLISGFLTPDSGKIFIDKKDITDLAPLTKANLISKVMQDPKIGTINNMTIAENMAFALKRGQNRGWKLFSNKEKISLFKEKLSILNMGLENRLDELVNNLSGGMRQGLSIIMAMLQNTRILLLDEITAALDPLSSQTIMDISNIIIRKQKMTCIMITHDLAHAIKYGDRLLILKNGNFVREYNKTDKNNLTTVMLTEELEKIV